MNTQEAIETIKNIDTLYINDTITGQQVDMVIKNQVLDIINQIDEPQKVVLPKFVAEWIEETKRVYNLYGAMGRIKDNLAPSEILKWFGTNPTLTGEILARAWLDGYEIDQEKLYTVEIPNPNDKQLALKIKRLRADKLVIAIDHTTNPITREYMVTESEIKKDFDWAFQFARPVEE